MWEIELSISNKDSDCLKNIYEYLKQKYNKKPILAYQIKDDKSILSIAFLEDETKQINALVKNTCQNIVTYYKAKYITQNIKFNKVDPKYASALKQALILFDIDDDIEEIKNTICKMKKINISSFYMFKMKNMTYKWNELCLIVNENLTGFVGNETFLELLRFLVEANHNKYNYINIYYDTKGFSICDDKGRVVSKFIKEETNLLTELISIAPKGINLHCIDNITNNMFKIMYYVFNKKINLLI